MPELREVILHGELARRFGKVHRFAVASAAEAVRALCANFPGFEQHLATSHQRGVAYNVWVGGENVSKDDLTHHSGGRIYLSPCVMGAKRGLFQTILGAVLIAAGAVVSIAGFPQVGIPLAFSGVGTFIGGVAALLTPTPKSQGASHTQSNYFDGPVNTTLQGNPVPVGYGTMLIGGAVISAGITIDQLMSGN